MSNFPWTPPMPTEIPEGFYPHWDGTAWVFLEIEKPAPPPVMEEQTIQAVQTEPVIV